MTTVGFPIPVAVQERLHSPSTAMKERAAELVHDMQLDAPAAPLILRPNSGGNVHEFTAVTACAMLDVLAPPYDPYGRRPCTYYQKQEGGGMSHVRCFAVASNLTLFFSVLVYRQCNIRNILADTNTPAKMVANERGCLSWSEGECLRDVVCLSVSLEGVVLSILPTLSNYVLQLAA